jgi:uncharacterized membrane protein YgaE (UPF0421/DUF939 family)
MTTFEKEHFAQHLINTAHYVKSHDEQSGYTSTRDMLCQTFEIAFETFDNGKLDWKDEELYAEIFDSIVEKLEEILA